MDSVRISFMEVKSMAGNIIITLLITNWTIVENDSGYNVKRHTWKIIVIFFLY